MLEYYIATDLRLRWTECKLYTDKEIIALYISIGEFGDMDWKKYDVLLDKTGRVQSPSKKRFMDTIRT